MAACKVAQFWPLPKRWRRTLTFDNGNEFRRPQTHAQGDPAAIAGCVDKSEGMDEAVARFVAAYAEPTDRDYEALAKAAREKRIRLAETGN